MPLEQPQVTPLVPKPQAPAPLFAQATAEDITSNYAWNKSQEDAVILGDPTLTETHYQSYLADGTVRSETLEMFARLYNDNVLINTGVLNDIHNLPKDQQVARLNHEVQRVDANKLGARQALTIHMMRAGYGNAPTTLRDEVFTELSPSELEGLRRQLEVAQTQRLSQAVNEIAAPIGTDFTTLSGTLGAVQSEFIPFFSIATRVVATRAFKPKGIEGLAAYWPGEIRQDIREWFTNAPIEERTQYLNDLGKEVEKLRKGKWSALFTDYLVIEQLMGVFTEDLLNENTPKATWDRVIGNADLLLETIYGIGLLAKAGTRGTKAIFKANNASSVRQAAKASGNTATLERIDDHIRQVAARMGITVEEASAVDIPRPAGLRDNMEVLPDSTKEIVEKADNIRSQVLVNLDPVTGQGLNNLDKANAIAGEIRALDNADGVHINHRMLNLEDLPNDTGVRITAVLGRTPGNGWDDFGDLVDDLVDLDPQLETFEIVRRNKVGELEKVDVSPNELAKFVVKGEVPSSVEQGLDPASASTRLFQGKRLGQTSKDDLQWWADNVDPKSNDYQNIVAELDRRAAGVPSEDTLKMLDGDEFYIRTTQDRYWHQGDKEFLGPETFQNTGLLPSGWVAPNARFGPDIYESFSTVYLKEQATLGQFNSLYKPFYDLPTKDKKVVENMFEWAEDFAKNRADAGTPRAPTVSELRAEFDGLTEAHLNGYVAVQEGLNLQWELFNRRLFRDFTVRGVKTARPVNPARPRYHGVPIKRETINRSSGTFLDPELNEAIPLTRQEVDDIYNGGGGFIKLDFPVTPAKGGRVDRVLVRAGDYELGPLSTRPLQYHPGYYMRFYDDPYMIIKKTENPLVNGTVRKGETIEEALRTAGTAAEGNRFIRNLEKNAKNRRKGVTYETKRVKDISNVEGTLFQEEALYREGRLFWDSRNFERLPDVNGNKARVNDIVRALEKGTAMAVRQTTHEDLMSTLRGAFGNEYGKGVDPILSSRTLANDDIKTVLAKLRTERAKTADPAKKTRINEAIRLAKYFRMQLGTDSRTVPLMREYLINAAAWVGEMGLKGKLFKKDSKTLLKTSRALESYFQVFDPYRMMKSVAFNVFMALRPVRQFALQSMQISYLSPLDPAYVASGKIFKDSLGLRRGVAKLRRSGYTDGLKDSQWAKTMGLTNKEYRRLVQEFERSGLLETVHVHTHSGGAAKRKRIPLPQETTLSRVAFKGKQFGHGTLDFFQKGFDLGEQNNLTFSYMVALRRHMKNNKLKSLTDISRKEFDDIAIDASNLALAMIRPNKFGYQSGYAGVVTQFLSFSHKAALGVLGKNPALSRADGFKIALGTYLLYGANMFGMEDFVREQLALIGVGNLADEDLGNGITLADVLSAGLIESGINTIAKASNEEWKDLDFGFLAPGVNTVQIYEKMFETILDQPEKVVLGPFYNPASGFLKGAEFVNTLIKGDPDMPAADKFIESAEIMLSNVLPGFNDANKAYIAGTQSKWLDTSGDALALQPTWNTIIARGLIGQRSKEELTLYRTSNRVWETEDNIRNAVDTNKRFLGQLISGWYDGEYSDEYIYNKVRVLSNLYEDWPQGARMEVFRRSMQEPDRNGKSFQQMFAELAAKGGTSPSLVPLIKNAPDMTPDQKRLLIQFNNEVFSTYEEGERTFLNVVEQDLKRRE